MCNQNHLNKDDYDVMEGAHYILKELAFSFSVPMIYSGFEKYISVYNKRWPELENMFNACMIIICVLRWALQFLNRDMITLRGR